MKRADTLVLNDGGMSGLVSLAACMRDQRLAMLFVFDGRAAQKLYHECIVKQAEYFEMDYVTELHLEYLCSESDKDEPMKMARQQLLVAAIGMAGEMNAQRLVWPIQAGEDFDTVAAVTEQIILLEQLAELELGYPLKITPLLLEVNNKQLIEIGHQMDVPWELSRSCTITNVDPCRGCEGCRRRTVAFREAMLSDPVVGVPLQG